MKTLSELREECRYLRQQLFVFSDLPCRLEKLAADKAMLKHREDCLADLKKRLDKGEDETLKKKLEVLSKELKKRGGDIAPGHKLPKKRKLINKLNALKRQIEELNNDKD